MMEKFHHTLPDGHVVTLPRFENVPMGVIRRTRKLPPVDQAFTIIEEFLDDDDLEHLDKLDREQFADFTKAWKANSATDLGESSASSTS